MYALDVATALIPNRGTLGFVPRAAIFSSNVISERMFLIRSSMGRLGFWKGYCDSGGWLALLGLTTAVVRRPMKRRSSRKIRLLRAPQVPDFPAFRTLRHFLETPRKATQWKVIMMLEQPSAKTKSFLSCLGDHPLGPARVAETTASWKSVTLVSKLLRSYSRRNILSRRYCAGFTTGKHGAAQMFATVETK